jgi:very-short-patch-repair endonuclease
MNNYYPDRIHNHKRFYFRRKELRNNATPEEIILWNYLKNSKLGFKFRRQHSIGGYIIDFYCPEKRITIELDGKHHDYQLMYDKTRDTYLQSLGVTVLRFKNDQVANDLDTILEKIVNSLKC